MIDVTEAKSSEQLDQVRMLFRSFVVWLRHRYADSIQVIDDYFDVGAYEEEIASLPGKYVRPGGRLLLATSDGHAAGCVALCGIDKRTCEMKRLFVDAQFHGKGVGRSLCDAIISEARAIGYLSMLLDTGIKQTEAQSLYRTLGFKEIKAYYSVPKRLEESLVFMELCLQS